jgi:hypothetical protein
MEQPLPPLPREALIRIEAAEKEARQQFDGTPPEYFPFNLEFSFREDSVLRSVARIIQHIRLVAVGILNANLTEYSE